MLANSDAAACCLLAEVPEAAAAAAATERLFSKFDAFIFAKFEVVFANEVACLSVVRVRSELELVDS